MLSISPIVFIHILEPEKLLI